MRLLLSQFFETRLQKIEKLYNIQLENASEIEALLLTLSALEFASFTKLLKTIQKANDKLSDTEQGPKTVETLLRLKTKYSLKNLAYLFSIIIKADLMHLKHFQTITQYMVSINEEAARFGLIEIFRAFAEIYSFNAAGYTYHQGDKLLALFCLKISDAKLIQLRDIIRNVPFRYCASHDQQLLSQNSEALEIILEIISLLTMRALASSKNLENVLHQSNDESNDFYTIEGLKVQHQLLVTLNQSHLLTQNNLDKLQHLKVSFQQKLLSSSQRLNLVSHTILINFIPLIITLSAQTKLTQPILEEILAEVKDTLQVSESLSEKEKTKMLNAFFEGTQHLAALPITNPLSANHHTQLKKG